MIPDHQSLMLPVLRLAAEGETRVPDVAGRIATDLGLTQADRDEPRRRSDRDRASNGRLRILTGPR